MKFSYKRLRLALFMSSYPGCFIKKQLRNKRHSDGWKEAYRLAKILDLDMKLLRIFIFSEKNPKQFLKQQLMLDRGDKEQIVTYLKIENEISALVLDREDKNSLVFEDYGRELLEPAIERVAGNHLSNIEDDLIFEASLEELKRKYKGIYYTIAYKYRLPTLRILPFIIRLIS